jgi:hypothetical protein
MAMRVVLHWAKWIGPQPYDNKGALDAAWMRILDGRHLSRLRPVTADGPTEGEPTENEPTADETKSKLKQPIIKSS